MSLKYSEYTRYLESKCDNSSRLVGILKRSDNNINVATNNVDNRKVGFIQSQCDLVDRPKKGF